MPDLKEFEKELAGLINKYSLENLSDTPDFILASYLVGCLMDYGSAVQRRRQWFENGGPMTTLPK